VGKWRSSIILACLAASSACARAPFRGPEQGGARWIEASSENFRLLTSQSDDDARETLNELEASQAVLEQIAFPSTENPPGVTEIAVLPEEDFAALGEAGAVNPLFVGYFREAELDFAQRPRLVVRAGFGAGALTLLQHELTHRFVAFHFPSAPTWLHEGLAEFWETLEIKHGTAYFGGALRTAYRPTAFDELLRLDAKGFYERSETEMHENYAAAAALARVLYFEHRPALTRYLNLLKSGQLTSSDAWARATASELPLIRQDFAAFFNEHGLQGELAAPQVTPHVDLFELSEAKVHLLWASLWPLRGSMLGRANSELAAALELEPDSVEALAMRSAVAWKMGEKARARADLERALQLGPARSQVLIAALGYSLASGDELKVPKAELARRLQRFTLTAPQLDLVARYLGSVNRLDDAVQLITKAVRIDSSCFRCYATGSQLLLARGDLPGAVTAFRTAVALAGERADNDERKHLAELEAKLATTR
jgi:tetratricopeptide (TPR) repeat protein